MKPPKHSTTLLRILPALLSLLSVTGLQAETITEAASSEKSDAPVSIDGYVDVYYMFHPEKTTGRNGAYTTQPVTEGQVAVNHALVSLRRHSGDMRLNLGLQAGTYVETNYAAEGSLNRLLYEANAAFRLGGSLWLEGGIFESHIGMESGRSFVNPTYTRSLMADLSPFYETGAALSWERQHYTLKALVLNGWQNITSSINSPAFGTQFLWKVNNSLTLNSSTFIGQVERTGREELRLFHDLYLLWQPGGSYQMMWATDIGIQNPTSSGYSETTENDVWFGTSWINRLRLNNRLFAALRLEYFKDDSEVLADYGNAFEAWGASAGLDWLAHQMVMVRFEVRRLEFTHRVRVVTGNQNLSSDTIAALSLTGRFD